MLRPLCHYLVPCGDLSVVVFVLNEGVRSAVGEGVRGDDVARGWLRALVLAVRDDGAGSTRGDMAQQHS